MCRTLSSPGLGYPEAVSGSGARFNLGAYIRKQRELAEMPMQKFSAVVGISNPYLSQIERGLRIPSQTVVSSIAAALGITEEELYQRAGVQTPSGSDLMTAIEEAEELTAAQRLSLAEIYRAFVELNRHR